MNTQKHTHTHLNAFDKEASHSESRIHADNTLRVKSISKRHLLDNIQEESAAAFAIRKRASARKLFGSKRSNTTSVAELGVDKNKFQNQSPPFKASEELSSPS